MELKDINLIFEYNRWANARTLEGVSKLDSEQFTREIKSSYSSIRDTLVHILNSQLFWLMLWKGSFLKIIPSPQDFPTFNKLQSKWAEVEDESRKVITDLTDESLQKEISLNDEGKQLKYKLWQTMLQIINHTSYHRGQVVTMLRQLNAIPPATDFLIFLDERGV